jgi:methyl-accepting chemotaxis protein
MNIANMKIGARLGAAFGLVLLLMAVLVAIGVGRLTSIGAINDRIIEKDWVKAEAANTINATIRINAEKTMELLIAPDKAHRAKVYEQIETNKKAIAESLDTLDKLIYVPEGKTMLAQIRRDRASYVASFSKVGKLIEDEKRDEAIQLMFTETMPALATLQKAIGGMLNLQKRLVLNSSAEARQSINFASVLMVGVGSVAIFLGISFAVWITRSITRPVREAVHIAQTVASGDLTSLIEVTATDETGQLLLALKEMNASLMRIVAEVRRGTGTIASASTQIAAGNLDLSARTEAQASSLEETASSMEELTSTVRQNADNARQANMLAASASDVALKGGSVVLQVVDTMGSINESSTRIADIIGVIDGIAFQTNILALNAAVEAARAGEQGRGFAVVASEVRNLAQRSAAAAKEIKNLIEHSVEKVDAGCKLVEQAGSTMDEIVVSVRRVTDIMGEIADASREQTAGIEQVNQAIIQMDHATQQNASLVEESAAAAQALHRQADTLTHMVSVFKLVDELAIMPAVTAPSVLTGIPALKRLPAPANEKLRLQ